LKEKDIQTLFSKVVEKDRNVAYELKIEKGRSMPFSRVAEHQIDALTRVKYKGLFHKISDTPHVQGSFRSYVKPFDCFTLKGEAYIAICFYEKWKTKEVILIDIDCFINETKISDRKSLTKDRAIDISTKVIKI
jgi:hypothetical protein